MTNTYGLGGSHISAYSALAEEDVYQSLSKIRRREIDINCLSGHKGLENAYQTSLGPSGGEFHNEYDDVRRFLHTQAQGKSVLFKIHVGKRPNVNDRILYFIPAANSIRSFPEGEKRHGFQWSFWTALPRMPERSQRHCKSIRRRAQSL